MITLKEIATTTAVIIVTALTFISREMPVADTPEYFDELLLRFHAYTAISFIALCLSYVTGILNRVIKFCLFLMCGVNLIIIGKILMGIANEPKYSDNTMLFGVFVFSLSLAFGKQFKQSTRAGKSAVNNLYMKWHQRKTNKTYGTKE